MPKVNLNDRVILTLTPQGVDAYKRWVDSNLPLPLRGGPYHSLNGEVLDTPLHELMNSLGPYFFNGAPQLVVDNEITVVRRSIDLQPFPPAGFYIVIWKKDEDFVVRANKALKKLGLAWLSIFPSERIEITYEGNVCMLRDTRGCKHVYQDISDRIMSIVSFAEMAVPQNRKERG